jgi:arylsulfatase A-like enzyme
MDATATALELAGAVSGQAKRDGVSFMPLLAGKTTEVPERTLFWRVGKQNVLRKGDWKLIRNGKEWQLYDLARDLGETTNLAAREPARVQQMLLLWDQWNAEQTEPLWR